MFKDYLIYDDLSEFLNRLYHHEEATERLPKIYAFYSQFEPPHANYVALDDN